MLYNITEQRPKHAAWFLNFSIPVLFIPVFILYLISKKKHSISCDMSANLSLFKHGNVQHNFINFYEVTIRNAGFRSLMAFRLGVPRCFRFLFFPCTGLCISVPRSKLGLGLKIRHGQYSRITASSIGNNVTIFQNVTIAYGQKGKPIIEDNVTIMAGASIINPITIGHNAVIGVGAVVINNVPPYAIVIGNPGKIVGFCKSPEEIIEYENTEFLEGKRMTKERIYQNYDKYYLSRISEIGSYIGLRI